MRTQIAVESAAGFSEGVGVASQRLAQDADGVGGRLTVNGTPLRLFRQDGRWGVRLSPRLTVWGDSEIEALGRAVLLCHTPTGCASAQAAV